MTNSSQKVIITGFGLMLLFLVSMTAVSLSNITALNNKINDLVHNRNVKTRLISEMRNIARERSLSLYRMVLLQDPFDIDEELIHMSLLAGQFINYREQLLQLRMIPSERKNIEATLQLVYQSTKVQKELLKIIHNDSFEQAKQFLNEQAIPTQNRLLEKYDQLIQFQNELSASDVLDADKKYQNVLLFLILFSIFIIIIGILVSLFVINKARLAEQKLREVNETLEIRVKDRTQSLFQANKELEATIQTLKDTQEQLVQAEKMASLGGLVAGIAHEINTPIGVGMTAITFLKDQEEAFLNHYKKDTMTREHLEQFMEHIHESCTMVINNLKRASDLIKNFKRIAVDQSVEDFYSIELYDYINGILLNLQPKLKQTKIKVFNQCPEQLTFFTNPGALYQIISNLILNSLLHAYNEDDSGKITIAVKQEQDGINIIFSDNGKGISEQNIKKIFDPFFTTSRAMGGSGLGLHIIYNLITTTLQGSIQVKSIEGQGCSFDIKLPNLDNSND